MMHSVLLLIHLIFAGLWLGCIVTEALFERALLGKGRDHELLLVDLHKRVDQFVEIPAFLIVLITGILMLPEVSWNVALLFKLGFGSAAVAANIYCAWLVFQRAAAAHAGRWDEFERLDHLQHKFGAIVLFSLLFALAMGVYLYAHV